jgi:hypothetical protein
LNANFYYRRKADASGGLFLPFLSFEAAFDRINLTRLKSCLIAKSNVKQALSLFYTHFLSRQKLKKKARRLEAALF